LPSDYLHEKETKPGKNASTRVFTLTVCQVFVHSENNINQTNQMYLFCQLQHLIHTGFIQAGFGN